MRLPASVTVAILGLVFAGSLPAMLRKPIPPPAEVAIRPAPQAAPTPAPFRLPAFAMPEVAGPAEYARMLAHCLAFEWKQAENVARRYVDLVDGRDRSEYVRGLLYRIRTQRIGSLADLRTGSTECAHCAGVSLHNLMLFFRHQGTSGWRKLGMPTRLVYETSLSASPGDRSLAIVRAGLMVDLGQPEEGLALLPVPPADLSSLDGVDIVNYAYVHAALSDRESLIVWLERAMSWDPESTREWAAESDDLNAFRNDPGVLAILSGEGASRTGERTDGAGPVHGDGRSR